MLLRKYQSQTTKEIMGRTIAERFSEQVRRVPNQLALTDQNGSYTYRTLDQKSDLVANWLIEKGVAVGEMVAVYLPRCADFVIALLGIMKAGAVYLPLDRTLPYKRKQHILETSEATVVIGIEPDYKEELFLSHNIHITTMQEIKEQTRNKKIARIFSAETPCYCIYTSGSTGKPKGILISHRNLDYFFSCHPQNKFQMELENRHSLYSTASVCFDLSIFEIFSALLHGLECVIASEAELSSFQKMAARIRERKVDVLLLTPSKFQLYCEEPEFCAVLSRISLLLLGAERFPAQLYHKIRALTSATIYNAYGPTETTIAVTFAQIEQEDSTIGTPIPGTTIHLLKENGTHCAVGEVGEICVASDGVGLGYVKQEEETKKKFVSNPFGKGMLYYTGDLAKWREDGNLEYIGRKDGQVKWHGLRIELEEMEQVILQIPQIKQAVVSLSEKDGKQFLCVHYVGEVGQEEIRKQLCLYLPAYMLPQYYEKLAQMPLNHSGKIDRTFFREWIPQKKKKQQKEVWRGTIARQFQMLLQEQLGTDEIAITDSFLELGVDSYQALQLLSKVEQMFGCTCLLQELLFCDQIANFITLIEQKQKEQTKEKEFVEYIEQQGYPITQSQKAVYFACQKQENQRSYQIPVRVRWEQKIEPKKLCNILQKIIENNEAFRTSFQLQNGTIMAKVQSQVSFSLEPVEESFFRPFDLTKAPLFRAGMKKEENGEESVYFLFHHLILDGISLSIFARQFRTIAQTGEWDHTKQYVRRQKQVDMGKIGHRWRELLRLPFGDAYLPTDYKRSHAHTFLAGRVKQEIPKQKILKLAGQMHVTPFILLKAVYDIFLSVYMYTDDIGVVVPYSARNGGNQSVIGMFVQTLLLRGKPTREKTVAQYCYEIQKQLEEVLCIGASAPSTEGIQTVFAYQGIGEVDFRFGNVAAETEILLAETAKFDFVMEVFPKADTFLFQIEYRTDLWKEETIVGMLDHFLWLLEQAAPERKIGTLCWITDQEEKYYKRWNETGTKESLDNIVTLFEEQVKKIPNQTAIIAVDQTMTYAALEEQSNRVANGILAVKPQLVVLLLPRTSFFVIAMLGVLKSGAAYLPMDPNYPRQRKQEMILDSQADCIITVEAEKIENHFAQVNVLTMETLLQTEKTELPIVKISQKQPCYCIYTSGSTGKPKGILITHENLANFCSKQEANICQTNLCKQCHTVVAIASVCFDLSVFELYVPLLNGISVVFASEEEGTDPGLLANLIEKYHVDGLLATPSRFQLYLQSKKMQQAVKNLSFLMLGAETMDQVFYHQIATYTDAMIFHGYGPTETTIGCTFDLLNGDEITIGRPVAQTQVYVLDENQKQVPIGAIGELWVAGVCVGVGYLHQKELTEERFLPNPFGEGRIYRTGDLVQWRRDGKLQYIGRIDSQVKIRGLRVELEEIAIRCMQQDGIRQAVAIVYEEQIIVFYVSDQEFYGEQLRRKLAQQLPQYMVPHGFQRVKEIPFLQSGKVDQKALQKMAATFTKTIEAVQAQTVQEKQILTAMQKILQKKEIGVTDDFFAFGGDSFKAIQLTMELQKQGYPVKLQMIFDAPTVQQLLETLQRDAKTKFSKSLPFVIRKEDQPRADVALVPVGDLFLTGATGFLGAHLAFSYLKKESGILYCLIRGNSQLESEKRWEETMQFYFPGQYQRKWDKRVRIICGDITKEHLGIEEHQIGTVTTVIHAAATVKHYGLGKEIEKQNVFGTKQVIEFCLEKKARLVYISTISVAASTNFENAYLYSKWKAEAAVLKAKEDGLCAAIMRVGNLTNRTSDGLFQKNYQENAFMKQLKAHLQLGGFPKSWKARQVEFSPVDDTANAILALLPTIQRKTIYHVNSDQTISFAQLQQYFAQIGRTLSFLEDTVFWKSWKQQREKKENTYLREIFLEEEQKELSVDHQITISQLQQQGFSWSEVTKQYIKQCNDYFQKIDYWRG